MIREIRFCLIVAIGTSLVGQPLVFANHGHGGGGGHSGGHGGGGHMGGGGHFGGGGGHSFGGGHSGFSGGHTGFSGGHTGHYGGVQHHTGGGVQQHTGGFQHNMGGVQHQVQQHMGNVQSHGFNQHQGAGQQSIGHQNFGQQHQSFNSTHQHLSHTGAQNLGGQNLGQHPHFGQQGHFANMHNQGTQHQLHAPFYQNHGHQNGVGHSGANGLYQNVSTRHAVNGFNSTAHQGSQFLSHHAHQAGQGLNGATFHHGAGIGTGLGGAGLHHGSSHVGSNNFLSHHHANQVSAVSMGHHGAFNHNHGWNNGHQNWNNGFHGHNNHNGYWNSNHYYNNHGWYGGSNYWRYPYYGYGSGFALGLGLGYGLGYGGYYGGYGLGYYNGYYGSYWPSYYGGYGYGGYGYGLNGYGYCLNGNLYSPYYGYAGCNSIGYLPNCAYQTYGAGTLVGDAGYDTSNTLISSGLAYGPTSQIEALGVATATDAAPAVVASTVQAAQPADTSSGASSGLPTAEQFAQIGETAFKNRDYKGAVRAWRHGLVDDPQNAILVMMLSQALFATEQYSESAGAVQAAVQALPPEKWDVVIKNFRDLYGKGEDYTSQLRALEKAAREKPDEPSMRFLLGYHYGFLGYAADAVKQLQKCVALAPRDEVAQKVLRHFEDKLPKKIEPPAPGQPPATTSDKSIDVPAPLDFIPPPPLNPEPSTAGLTLPKAPAAPTKESSDSVSATTPANSSPK